MDLKFFIHKGQYNFFLVFTMDFYTIHTKNEQTSQEAIAVKEGFNWYNLIFNFFWALYKQTWILATIYIALQILLICLTYFDISPLIVRTLTMITYIMIAFQANDFYRYSLKLKGYKFKDIVLAKSSSHAIYNFLKKSS